MNVLLVNLSRMGDLVQTTPSACALKHSGARVSLLVAEHLKGFAGGLAGVDEVLAFDQEKLSDAAFGADDNLAKGYLQWKHWVRSLQQQDFDLVVNLTHDRLSSRLAYLIGGKRALGRLEKPDGSAVVNGAWSRYFYATLNSRRANPFNLVDIYRRACGIEGPAGPVGYKVSQAGIGRAAMLLEGVGRPLAAIHPGANHPNRRWPVERYAELTDRLHAQGVNIVLLGGSTERQIAETFSRLTHSPYLDLAGKTDLDELAGVLKSADLLITNDTGPLHLSAAVETPTVSIFLAMARPEDTAPYREGQWVIETLDPTHPSPENTPPNGSVCGMSVPVEAVLETSSASLQHRKPDMRIMAESGGLFRLRSTEFDGGGYLVLRDVYATANANNPSMKAEMLRNAWISTLDESPVQEADGKQLESLSEDEKSILGSATELGHAIIRKLSQLASSSSNSTSANISLAELEKRWYALEQVAGDFTGMLLAFRLERECYYLGPKSELLDEAPEKLKRWVNLFELLSGVGRKEEVAA